MGYTYPVLGGLHAADIPDGELLETAGLHHIPPKLFDENDAVSGILRFWVRHDVPLVLCGKPAKASLLVLSS